MIVFHGTAAIYAECIRTQGLIDPRREAGHDPAGECYLTTSQSIAWCYAGWNAGMAVMEGHTRCYSPPGLTMATQMLFPSGLPGQETSLPPAQARTQRALDEGNNLGIVVKLDVSQEIPLYPIGKSISPPPWHLGAGAQDTADVLAGENDPTAPCCCFFTRPEEVPASRVVALEFYRFPEIFSPGMLDTFRAIRKADPYRNQMLRLPHGATEQKRGRAVLDRLDRRITEVPGDYVFVEGAADVTERDARGAIRRELRDLDERWPEHFRWMPA